VRLRTIVAAIVGSLFTILIGSSMSAGEGATDGCSLLTPAQVSAVLGVSVGAGQHILPSSPAGCGWAQPSDSNHSGKRVVLDIWGPIGKLTPGERFTNGKKPVAGIPKTPISGVGDDAYYITTPGLGTGLNVKKGTSVFQVRVYGFSLDQIKAMEKSLAQNAIAKL
jgi:hypothetical protein